MGRCTNQTTLRKGKAIISVNCGKCMYCLSSKRADWSFRIFQEMLVSRSAHFLTMTYNEPAEPKVYIGDSKTDYIGTLQKKDLQLFVKQLRNKNDRSKTFKDFPSIKYYAVGEYGGQTWRPHYHAIVFNLKPETLTQIDSIWDKGWITRGSVEPASIHYCTKYVLNPADDRNYKQSGLTPPFSLISKGMGQSYLRSNGFEHKKALQAFVFGNRGRQRLPRYYKDKIFNVREKELLGNNAILENDILYQKTVDALKQFTDEPDNEFQRLYEEKRQQIENQLKESHKTTKLIPHEYLQSKTTGLL